MQPLQGGPRESSPPLSLPFTAKRRLDCPIPRRGRALPHPEDRQPPPRRQVRRPENATRPKAAKTRLAGSAQDVVRKQDGSHDNTDEVLPAFTQYSSVAAMNLPLQSSPGLYAMPCGHPQEVIKDPVMGRIQLWVKLCHYLSSCTSVLYCWVIKM